MNHARLAVAGNHEALTLVLQKILGAFQNPPRVHAGWRGDLIQSLRPGVPPQDVGGNGGGHQRHPAARHPQPVIRVGPG